MNTSFFARITISFYLRKTFSDMYSRKAIMMFKKNLLLKLDLIYTSCLKDGARIKDQMILN